MELIGSKERFAVEFEVTSLEPILTGKSCIWIEGQFLGNYEFTGTLSMLHDGLQYLKNKRGEFYNPEFLGLTPNDVMLKMIPNLNAPKRTFDDFSAEEQSNLVRYDDYIFSFGENYDSFVVRIFAIAGRYHFLWKLVASEKLQSSVWSLKDYSRNLKQGMVSLENLDFVVDKFSARYFELNGE